MKINTPKYMYRDGSLILKSLKINSLSKSDILSIL